MKKTANDLIEEYYEKVKDEYPGVSLEEFKIICNSPWSYLRDIMSKDELPEMRFKYLGVFKVRTGRARYYLEVNENRFKKGLMEEEQYLKYKKMLTEHVKKNS